MQAEAAPLADTRWWRAVDTDFSEEALRESVKEKKLIGELVLDANAASLAIVKQEPMGAAPLRPHSYGCSVFKPLLYFPVSLNQQVFCLIEARLKKGVVTMTRFEDEFCAAYLKKRHEMKIRSYGALTFVAASLRRRISSLASSQKKHEVNVARISSQERAETMLRQIELNVAAPTLHESLQSTKRASV